VRLLCLFVALALVGGPVRARADAALDSARAHLFAGIAYYDEARYDDAAREMEAAYRLKPLPALLYNLAQCYERLGRAADAAETYRRYLSASPRAEDRVVVETRIRNLEERAETAPPEKVVMKTIVVYRERPPPGRAARWAGGGVAALGLAALGAGIATAVLAGRAADDLAAQADPANPMPFEGVARDAQNRGETLAVVAGVSFGLALLAAGGSLGLFLIGKKIDREADKAVLLAPLVGPRGGGLVLGGRF
jgi:tetratricopeptide (TPR) repeat protein